MGVLAEGFRKVVVADLASVGAGVSGWPVWFWAGELAAPSRIKAARAARGSHGGPTKEEFQDSARPYLKLFLTCMYSGNAELVVARVTNRASFAQLGGGVGERVRRRGHIGMAAGAGVGGQCRKLFGARPQVRDSGEHPGSTGWATFAPLAWAAKALRDNRSRRLSSDFSSCTVARPLCRSGRRQE